MALVAPRPMGRLRPHPLYHSNQSRFSKGGTVTKLTSMGHLIIGSMAIVATTVLGVLHDIPGSTAVEAVLAVTGVSLGIGALTNSNPLPPA